MLLKGGRKNSAFSYFRINWSSMLLKKLKGLEIGLKGKRYLSKNIRFISIK